MDYATAGTLAIALAIGLVIGSERSWHAREEGGAPRSAGLRSFALVGLLGGVAALLLPGAPLLAAALFAAVAGFALLAYHHQMRLEPDPGITSELALLVTFALGLLAGLGRPAEAVAAGVVVTLLLRFKPQLHGSLARLSGAELTATLQLLVLAAVVLPLLPDRPLDPWDTLVPRRIGFLVLLIAGVSYLGYFTVRLLGARGGLMTAALFGGLASSTAVTLSFAPLARREPGAARLVAAAIALASATMVPRLLLLIAALDPGLAAAVAPALGVLGGLPLLALPWLVGRTAAGGGDPPLRLNNPLDLKTALFYGGLLAVLGLAVHFAGRFGETGLYGLALISGLLDADATALSLAQWAAADPAPGVARAIVLAAAANTLTKGALGALLGGRRLGAWTLGLMGGAAAAAVLVAWR